MIYLVPLDPKHQKNHLGTLENTKVVQDQQLNVDLISEVRRYQYKVHTLMIAIIVRGDRTPNIWVGTVKTLWVGIHA
jgi:hypothetical protein